MIVSGISVSIGVLVGVLVITPYKHATTTTTTTNEYKLFDETTTTVTPSATATATATTTTVTSSSNIITKNVAEVKRQLLVLLLVLRSSSLSSLSLLWVVGNSVYTIIYGYEVSLLLDVGGPDSWNGFILSLLLLSGVSL
jgi:hypothetical protein